MFCLPRIVVLALVNDSPGEETDYEHEGCDEDGG